MKLLSFLFFSAILIVACNQNSKKKKTEEPKLPVETINSGKKEVAQFMVSFISIGNGINRDAEKQLLQLIEEFNTKNNVKLLFEKKNWGREGERNYCFAPQKMLMEFYSLVREKLGTAKNIQIHENKNCE